MFLIKKSYWFLGCRNGKTNANNLGLILNRKIDVGFDRRI